MKRIKFGELCKEQRGVKSLSQTQVASEARISNSYYSDIEKGNRPPPVGNLLSDIRILLFPDIAFEWLLAFVKLERDFPSNAIEQDLLYHKEIIDMQIKILKDKKLLRE